MAFNIKPAIGKGTKKKRIFSDPKKADTKTNLKATFGFPKKQK